MKRCICLLIICALALSLAACAPEGYEPVIGATPTPVVTPSPRPSPTPSPTVIPTPTPAPTPEPAPTPTNVPMFTEFKAPGENTVIVADERGLIVGGWSDGAWLSHSQAAAYCGGRMAFYRVSLDGQGRTMTSAGVMADDGPGVSATSVTASMESGAADDNDPMALDLGGSEAPKDILLISNAQGRIPEIIELGTSAFLPLIQGMLDAQFGVGAVAARIQSAYELDIDGDGTKETLINASNADRNEYAFDSHAQYPENWYSIVCLVGEGGTVRLIEQSYSDTYLEDSGFACARGVADMDGDGVCEVIVELAGFEWRGMSAYRFDGQDFTQVFNYGEDS